ncbi:MAG: substrate-binding domain-containing protein, partial [Clostridia bacterium]|nr:substrate-binding domain-containing protein [Clostridia bacterium]
GYKMGLEAAGIEYDGELVLPCHYRAKEGYDATEKICAMPPEKRPTAIFFAQDLLAAGGYRYFYEHGFRVPEDFSLMGYENLSLSVYMNPRLSTVDWKKSIMTEKACSMLLDRLKKPRSENGGVVVPCDIIRRESVLNIN